MATHDTGTIDLTRLPSRDLGTVSDLVSRLDAVHKAHLVWGDRVVVETRNSRYVLHTLAEGRFAVSGGWFDHQSEAPQIVGVLGCTWGGRAVHTQIVAAPGLFLEFSNGVVTTRIQSVRVERHDELTGPH